jgi:hypothetical protein
VVGVSIENDPTGPAVSSITYNGQTLTEIDSVEVSSSGTMGRVELWYLLEADLPGSGSYNVVVTLSQATNELTAGAISLTDVAQQAPEASNTNSNVGQDTISSNITTLTDGAWLVDVVHCGEESGGFAANGGQSERYDRVTGSSEGAGSTKPVAGAGATSAGWTFNTGANRLAHVVAAFAPATGCGGGGGGGTIDQRISDDADDSEEYISSGSHDWGSSDLELGEEGSPQRVGMRWRNVAIPQGATITSAYIEFTVDETDSETTNLTFKGEDADNAAVFQNVTNDIYNRTTTSASVAWNNVPAWSTVGATHQSPDISPVIQEIVNRGGWSSGNALVVIVTGSGTRVADSHDSSPSTAPLLHVVTGGSLATLELTLSSAEGGTVSMRTKVYLRNMP